MRRQKKIDEEKCKELCKEILSRLDRMDKRFDSMHEQMKSEFAALNKKIDRIEKKVDFATMWSKKSLKTHLILYNHSNFLKNLQQKWAIQYLFGSFYVEDFILSF